MNRKNILTFVIIFLLINFVMGFFTPKNNQSVNTGDFTVSTTKKDYEQNEHIEAKIRNNTKNTVTIPNDCPNEPLDVLVYQNGQWMPKTGTSTISCDNTKEITINPDEEITINYSSWNHTLFGETGRYKVKANISVQNQNGPETRQIESTEFEIKPQGWFGLFWTSIFYQPTYNILIFLASGLPWHDLGLAIILLTILIRTLLLIPSQKALKSQRKMQEIQPKLAQLKEKHKDNPEMVARETLALWKEHKVNPYGSCMPLLIQFPILIALYSVISNGVNPDTAYLLYGPLKDFNLVNVNLNFLGILDLTKINSFVLPIIVGALQFIQMKLAVFKAGNKNKKTENKDQKKSESEMANQIMIYVMPVMIALFTASAPAGVGLYWSISTIYGIAQQFFVNKSVDRESVKVRVIS